MAKPDGIHRNWKHIDVWDNRKIDFMQEVQKHPKLIQLIEENDHAFDFEFILAEAAVFVGVILDGQYTESELLNLCDILTKRLMVYRTGVSFPTEIEAEQKEILKDSTDLTKH